MLYLFLGVVVLFFAVILIRALLFVPKRSPAPDTSPVEFDREGSVEALAALIQCRLPWEYEADLYGDVPDRGSYHPDVQYWYYAYRLDVWEGSR